MLLQRGKEKDKGNILTYTASSSISIVLSINQITPLSIRQRCDDMVDDIISGQASGWTRHAANGSSPLSKQPCSTFDMISLIS